MSRQGNISIIGYGVSGRGAEALARKNGLSVSVFDDKIPAENLPRSHDFADTGLFVVSPGVSMKSAFYRDALATGAPIVGELEFGASRFDGGILAITGTNGKTTTTELTNHLLAAAGLKTVAAGNIGLTLSEVAASGEKYDCSAVEVSSFQLERCVSFAPLAAALLNITSDHLDRYDGMDGYSEMKFRVFKNILAEKGRFIINSSLRDAWARFGRRDVEPLTFSASDTSADLHLADGAVFLRDRKIVDMADTSLFGAHNAENLMAALALVRARLGDEFIFSDTLKKAVSSFRCGPHRMEVVAEKNGVRYVNDSKGTNPDAVLAALRAFGGDSNVLILLGGLDKDMDFSLLLDEKARVRKAFLLGQCRGKIAAAIDGRMPFELFDSFDSAALKACSEARPGDVVMLSPACASMDMFKNYAERGERFRSIVAAFIAK